MGFICLFVYYLLLLATIAILIMERHEEHQQWSIIIIIIFKNTHTNSMNQVQHDWLDLRTELIKFQM